MMNRLLLPLAFFGVVIFSTGCTTVQSTPPTAMGCPTWEQQQISGMAQRFGGIEHGFVGFEAIEILEGR